MDFRGSRKSGRNLFRDAVDALTLTRDWDQAKIALHLVDLGGQAINTGSAMGRMFLTMMAGFAELERNLISERTSTAMHHLQAQGRHVGAPPLGEGALAENAEEIATLKRMAELRNQGLTLQQVADTLSAKGFPTKRGGGWHPATIAQGLGRMA